MDNEPQKEPSKISGTEWFMVIFAVVIIDLIQVGFTLLAIPSAGFTEFLNEALEFFIGPILIFYFWIRGIKLTWQRAGSLLAAFCGELIPVVDAAPFWTLDVVYMYLSVKAEEGGMLGTVAGAASGALNKKTGSGVQIPAGGNPPPRLPQRQTAQIANQSAQTSHPLPKRIQTPQLSPSFETPKESGAINGQEIYRAQQKAHPQTSDAENVPNRMSEARKNIERQMRNAGNEVISAGSRVRTAGQEIESIGRKVTSAPKNIRNRNVDDEIFFAE